MASTDALLDRYMDELQPLFGEAEVIDQRIPSAALMEVTRFFNMFALCVHDGGEAPGEGDIAQAHDLLDRAICLCHQVLTTAYYEQCGCKMRQYGIEPLKNAGNAQILPELEAARNEAREAIREAQRIEQEENVRARKEFGIGADEKLSEGIAIDIQREMAACPKLQEAMRAAHEKAHMFYDLLVEADLDIAYSKDHGETESEAERMQKIGGRVTGGIGMIALVVSVVKHLLGT